MVLEFYTSVAKGLKLKVRKFWELTLTVEIRAEKSSNINEVIKAVLNILHFFTKIFYTHKKDKKHKKAPKAQKAPKALKAPKTQKVQKSTKKHKNAKKQISDSFPLRCFLCA